MEGWISRTANCAQASVSILICCRSVSTCREIGNLELRCESHHGEPTSSACPSGHCRQASFHRPANKISDRRGLVSFAVQGRPSYRGGHRRRDREFCHLGTRRPRHRTLCQGSETL